MYFMSPAYPARNPFGKCFEFGGIGGWSNTCQFESGLLGGPFYNGLNLEDGTGQPIYL